MIKISAKKIATHFGKTEQAIKKHAQQRGLSLKNMGDTIEVLVYYHHKAQKKALMTEGHKCDSSPIN